MLFCKFLCLDCLISWKLVHGFTAAMASYLILGKKKDLHLKQGITPTGQLIVKD